MYVSCKEIHSQHLVTVIAFEFLNRMAAFLTKVNQNLVLDWSYTIGMRLMHSMTNNAITKTNVRRIFHMA